ncbi:MAG TPA: MerR family transcriptional regulator [Pyrinomonadaceae bacterium]
MKGAKVADAGTYTASEFARRAGVTVRALHHYDRLGLLKPARRTAAGYRLYTDSDFARLQQIVTLKFIGLSLKQIRDVLRAGAPDLRAALRLQREILEEKGRRLRRAVRAVEQAERVLERDGRVGPEAFAKIIEVIEMQNNTDWMMRYYSEGARKKIDERAAALGQEAIEQGQRDWAQLIAEVDEAARAGVDPASERAQELAARWQSLIEAFTGGDAEVAAGLRKLYADQSNWPASFRKPYGDEAGRFIAEAAAARKRE